MIVAFGFRGLVIQFLAYRLDYWLVTVLHYYSSFAALYICLLLLKATGFIGMFLSFKNWFCYATVHEIRY